MTGSDFTARLGLPYLLPGQAQKHVTVNESLDALDALVMASVEAIGVDTVPSAPVDGQAWLIGAAPSGAWANAAGALAIWRDAAWGFYIPRAGWRVWDVSAGALSVFDGAVWSALGGDTQELEFIGLATTADASNPFAARLNTALWTARETSDGGSGDLRLTLNKEAAGNVGSLVFQSGWSGRAEMGLVGTDDFSFRVSPDGTAWSDAIEIEQDEGRVGLGGAPGGLDRLTVHGKMRVKSSEGYFIIRDDGTLEMSRANGGAIYLRGRSLGSVVNLGATDSAGVVTGSILSLRPDAQDVLSLYNFAPSNSAAVDLGSGARVWRDLYVQNAPIVSSDRRGKCQIDDLCDAPTLIEFLRPVAFRRREDGPVHYGFVAQEVRQALAAIGQEDAALWALSDPGDEASTQALRQEELIAVLVSAMQRLAARVDALEQQPGPELGQG